jgi:hypothetical protein
MGIRSLTRTSPDSGRYGMYQYGPKGRYGASIWLSGAHGQVYATVKFRNQETDLSGGSVDEALQAAVDWVDAAPELSHLPRRSSPSLPPGTSRG